MVFYLHYISNTKWILFNLKPSNVIIVYQAAGVK